MAVLPYYFMQKVILLWLFLFGSLITFAQKKYVCEFADTMTMNLPDSVLRQMSNISTQQGIELTPEMMEQIFAQIRAAKLAMYQLRIVRAEKDQTIISIDRSSRSGNLTMETFDSILYKNDEIFQDSASASGFSQLPVATSRKDFFLTGNSKVIMNYKCNEYKSADSTCYIWVTTELPDYINPGIRKGKIKGAVLGFELKANASITKCMLTGFGRGL